MEKTTHCEIMAYQYLLDLISETKEDALAVLEHTILLANKHPHFFRQPERKS